MNTSRIFSCLFILLLCSPALAARSLDDICHSTAEADRNACLDRKGSPYFDQAAVWEISKKRGLARAEALSWAFSAPKDAKFFALGIYLSDEWETVHTTMPGPAITGIPAFYVNYGAELTIFPLGFIDYTGLSFVGRIGGRSWGSTVDLIGRLDSLDFTAALAMQISLVRLLVGYAGTLDNYQVQTDTQIVSDKALNDGGRVELGVRLSHTMIFGGCTIRKFTAVQNTGAVFSGLSAPCGFGLRSILW